MGENTKILAVARSELKFLLDLPDRLYFLDACNKLLTKDAYGDYNGYTVRSVYFDSITNEDYMDKILGNPIKKRVRLRAYHPDDKTAKFEMKRKKYGRELKESLVVSREDGAEILKRNYGVLLNYDSDFARYSFELLSTRRYRPVAVVEYERRAYTHEHFNTRVTLDNNLRYCPFDYNLFSHHLNFQAAMPKDETILEIKYDRFLFKQIQEALRDCDLSRTPPSKYGTSRSMLKYCYY